MGYIEGNTITLGSWGFSQRVFSAHPNGNQNFLHELVLEAEFKEQIDWWKQQEVVTTRWIVLVRSVLLLSYRLRKWLQ